VVKRALFCLVILVAVSVGAQGFAVVPFGRVHPEARFNELSRSLENIFMGSQRIDYADVPNSVRQSLWSELNRFPLRAERVYLALSTCFPHCRRGPCLYIFLIRIGSNRSWTGWVRRAPLPI